ncbi:hypothetical protein ACSSS7_005154 [Eimeria intestinalis]
MAERKRRADSNHETQGERAKVVPEATAGISKRVRSKASCQDRYLAASPYEFPAEEEAAHRIITAYWAQKEALAAHAAATDATGNSRISGTPLTTHSATSQGGTKSHHEIFLHAGACGVPSFGSLPTTVPDLHNHPECRKRAVPVDDSPERLPLTDPVFRSKACTESLRSARAPVLLGLERHYCQPQPHPWVPPNSEIFH